jgi:NADH-quinone oxidoreductase subunit L
MDTVKFLWVVPFLPFAGAFLNLVLGKRLSRQTVHFIAVAAVAAAFFTALYLVIGPLREAHGVWAKGGKQGPFELNEHLWTWIQAGDLKLDLAFRLDPLSSVMILIVTFCSTLIHIYSTGYMEHEPRYAAYFGYLNLFTGAMLILVLGANMPVMFIGWEGVGLCSFLLIGFWYENEAYATAGRKAFVVNRIGDFAFLLGMFLLWYATHGADGGRSLDFTMLREVATSKPDLFTQTFWFDERLAAAGGILLFIGAAGKSAQLPLYVWLPDAMAGPTPVSALIHAATMVTAGVYMVARLSFLFSLSTTAMAVVATVGLLTALAAAFMAFAQTDLKKVLAYSTVSQLGFMFVAVGTGNWAAGVFHLMTHAFFKAGLFLGAGSVMHGMDGSGDIRIMGGLKKYMPITRWTFLIYCLAIAGVPLTSGFFSKDEILAGAFAAEHQGWPVWYGKALWAGLTLAALGTAFYMWRLYFLVFEGEYRGKAQVAHPHESPIAMTGPLVVLAFLALVAGFIGIPHVIHLGGTAGDVTHFLPNWIGLSTRTMDLHLAKSTTYILLVVASVVGLAGIGLAYALYGKGPSPWVERFTEGSGKGLYEASKNKLWVDEGYDLAIVRPFRALARGTFEIVDRFIIDTVIVNGAGFVMSTASRVSRWVQNGQVQRYLVGVVLGGALIFWWTSHNDHPSFSYREVPGGIEFRAEPGHGLRSGAAVQWDFDGDGQPDPGETELVVVKRAGDVASRVTLFVVDPVWGDKPRSGPPKNLARVTRKIERRAVPVAAPVGGAP